MLVTCWGARGSIATPGSHTLRFGGNTSCISVEIDDAIVILDAGTGIRALGHTAAASDKDLIVVLSHVHFDHICGFPFFQPIFQDRTIHLVDYVYGDTRWSLRELMDGRHFPATPGMLPSTLKRERDAPEVFLSEYGLNVQRIAVNHPGGAFGFRLTTGSGSLVYVPDNELFAPSQTLTFDELSEFCRGADALIHDAQYVSSEMEGKKGWGHSAMEDTTKLACESGVGRLLLFHHDPIRTDDAVAEIERNAQGMLEPADIRCEAAREGMALEI